MPDSTYAWACPADPAAIALVWVPAMAGLLDRRWPQPGRARFAHLRDAAGALVDEVVATRLSEDLGELACHGGSGVRARVSAALAGHGLNAGCPGLGEAWRRCATCAHPAALPLVARGHPVPNGFAERVPRLLLTGPSNAGKSALVNAWCGRERALVSALAGTTRDLLVARTVYRGWNLDLIDSAGLRATDDALERGGQALVAAARAEADLVLHCSPVDAPCPPADRGDLLVHTKADLLAPGTRPGEGVAVTTPAHGGAVESERALAALGDAVLAALGLQI